MSMRKGEWHKVNGKLRRRHTPLNEGRVPEDVTVTTASSPREMAEDLDTLANAVWDNLPAQDRVDMVIGFLNGRKGQE